MTREELAARLYTEAADLLVTESKKTAIASTIAGAAIGDSLTTHIIRGAAKSNLDQKQKEYNRIMSDDSLDAEAKRKAVQKITNDVNNFNTGAGAAIIGGTIAGGVLGNKLNKIIENHVAAKKATAGKTSDQLDALIDKLESFIKKYEASTDPAFKKANKREYSKSKAILKKAKEERLKVVREFVEDYGYDDEYLAENYSGFGSIFDQLDDMDVDDIY